MKKFSLLFAIFLFFSPKIFAQNLTTNPGIIIQQIAAGTGALSKAEYDQFWQTLGISSRADKERMIGLLRSGFLLMQEYQKEIWSCVETSWISRATVRCDRARQKFNLMNATMNEEQKLALKKMDENSQRMILAAAKREDFEISKDAVPLKFSIENIKAIRGNLEKMLKRITQVLRVEY